MESQTVFQAKTQAKKCSIELGPWDCCPEVVAARHPTSMARDRSRWEDILIDSLLFVTGSQVYVY